MAKAFLNCEPLDHANVGTACIADWDDADRGTNEALAEMEAIAHLFVIGQRGEAAEAASEHIGGNLERVVRALHKPILVAPKEFRVVHNVMVAFDGSTTTRMGIDMLASSPLFRGYGLHVVMAGGGSSANQAQLD